MYEALSVGVVLGLVLISFVLPDENPKTKNLKGEKRAEIEKQKQEDIQFYSDMYKKSEKKTIYSKNIHIKDHLSEKYSEFTALLEKGDHIGFKAKI